MIQNKDVIRHFWEATSSVLSLSQFEFVAICLCSFKDKLCYTYASDEKIIKSYCESKVYEVDPIKLIAELEFKLSEGFYSFYDCSNIVCTDNRVYSKSGELNGKIIYDLKIQSKIGYGYYYIQHKNGLFRFTCLGKKNNAYQNVYQIFDNPVKEKYLNKSVQIFKKFFDRYENIIYENVNEAKIYTSNVELRLNEILAEKRYNRIWSQIKTLS